MVCKPISCRRLIGTLELSDSVTMLQAPGKRWGIISDLCLRPASSRSAAGSRRFFPSIRLACVTRFLTRECASWNYPHLRLFTDKKKSLAKRFCFSRISFRFAARFRVVSFSPALFLSSSFHFLCPPLEPDNQSSRQLFLSCHFIVVLVSPHLLLPLSPFLHGPSVSHPNSFSLPGYVSL